MTDILYIIGGLVLLYIGGERLLRGSISIANNLKLSKLLVSTVIIGFGTSTPELVVSLQAMFENSPEIAVGNVIGSNIANIFLIIGVAGLISPIHLKKIDTKLDNFIMALSAFMIFIFIKFNYLNLVTGSLMIITLISYIVYSYIQHRNTSKAIEEISEDIAVPQIQSNYKALGIAVFGLGLLVIGSQLLVKGAISLAQAFNVSEAVIGLTIVAVGTSLPELATAVVSSIHKHNEAIIGNIVGSNIFNILFILGITSIITSINITGQIASVDIYIMLTSTLIFSTILALKINVSRILALIFLILYGLYTLHLYGIN